MSKHFDTQRLQAHKFLCKYYSIIGQSAVEIFYQLNRKSVFVTLTLCKFFKKKPPTKGGIKLYGWGTRIRTWE